jgi:hypothetical protein
MEVYTPGTESVHTNSENGSANGKPHDPPGDPPDQGQAWHDRAEELTAWTRKYLVVREDCYGRYWTDKSGAVKQTTEKHNLTDVMILRHWQAKSTVDVIGLHTTKFLRVEGAPRGGECVSKGSHVDIDHHGDGPPPEGNRRAAIAWHDALKGLGFRPLLVDSNGRGGFKLYVLYDQEITATHARRMARWLTRDWADYGLPEQPECFPKQDEIAPPGSAKGSFGNWVRIPGRHPKRDHWATVWDGTEFVSGDEAIDIILDATGDSPQLIPAQAAEFERDARRPPGDQQADKPRSARQLAGDARLAKEALAYLGKGKQDELGRDILEDYDAWLRIGACLHGLGDVGLEIWDEWSRQGSSYQEGACKAKWETFSEDRAVKARLGTLLWLAQRLGWDGLAKKEGKNTTPASYRVVNGCLYADAGRLANFSALILQEVTRHVGGEKIVLYRIQATHCHGRTVQRDVEAEKYKSMSWIYSFGAEFAIDPGREVCDMVRHGIQELSVQSGIGLVAEHTSLGWIRRGEGFLYLHAGGAIGPEGSSEAVEVKIDGALGKYRLPVETPDQATLQRAMDAHVDLWSLAKADRPGGRGAAAITATLPWRAVLSAFDASVHFGGPSGNKKTSIARLAYQHFSDVKGRGSPMSASWRSTENALQRMAFDVKDSLLVIDDLKFEDHVKKAETLMQSQGDLQNRLRMNVNQSLQQALDPRGSLLSTGEIDPLTRSTLGRGLKVEIGANDIDLPILTRLQDAGDGGLFASLMRAYIQSLAGRIDRARDDHARLTTEIRQKIGEMPDVHPRHPDIIAQLVAAYRLFMTWCAEQRLINPIAADSYVGRAQALLIELGDYQADPQAESRPGRQFLGLIASGLSSGRCHLQSKDSDSEPKPYPQRCGWRHDGEHWRVPSGSTCVGYISNLDDKVYLDPIECQAIATKMAKEQRNPQCFASIGRELMQEELVVVQQFKRGDKAINTAAGPKRIHGARKRYYWVDPTHIFGTDDPA